MNAGGVLDLNHRLPSHASSAARARRFVSASLRASLPTGSELVDTAVLLVSEVVTNAVLHAGTGIEVRVVAAGTAVRVEVRDRSAVMPSRRHYEGESSTGRGLELVEILASSWGTDPEPEGKVVWFELGAEQPSESLESERPESESRSEDFTSENASDKRAVSLLNLPVALVWATLEYGDAVLRELVLVSLNHHDDVTVSASELDLDIILGPVSNAMQRGETTIDLEVTFPPTAARGARRRMGMVEHAHRLALNGRLLALPAVPEIMLCRHWLLSEIQRQVGGEPPRAWKLPSPVDLGYELVGLSEQERAEVEALTAPTVTADDSNRILHVSESAEELLGWPPGELVGKRLTTIIPPAMREHHLAGFTRFQLTEEGPILGKHIRVQALRRNGTVVDILLKVEVATRTNGTRMFRAQLTRPEPQHHQRPEAP